MTLSFSTKINGKPNYFIEKIWRSFLKGVWMNGKDFTEKFDTLSLEQRARINDVFPKIHTIREDSSNRWKAGRDIHMVINNRTKNRFQFAPVVKCVSEQPFKIEWINDIAWVSIGERSFTTFQKTDIGFEYGEKAEVLARNDGFDSVKDFFAYFNTDFNGKLIHWTDFKY